MPDATLGAQLQAQYANLQGCVTQAQQLCSELSTIADAALAAYEEQDHQASAASSAQLDLQGLQLDEDYMTAGTAEPASPRHEPQQQASTTQADQAQDTQQQAQRPDSGILTTPQDSALQEQAAAADHQQLRAGELLFCVQALQQALGQQLQLMTKVASAVALDMPAEELSTYATLWELQPYLDAEAMAAALQQLAAP